ncbi:hypothetical protein [Novosphingobium huizhouense]|uniref:hypothetical protein n=1 Tax=Novosphingobium huizhouense TaxID=2866625 RepID=UPI001CD82438|nr:hypothetical protein [Novosphingobium huizhouense]
MPRAVPAAEPVEPLPAPSPEATAAPAPAPTSAPVPAPSSPPRPRADASRESDPLVLVLQAKRLSATLVNTTLAYRIVALNRGREPLEDIAIGGDMIAAHASRSVEEQLGLVGPELPPIHRIDRLEPGGEVVLEGEMKLPLAAVMPIRHAEQALFVPLARLDAWASATDGRAVRARAAWLVGQEAKPAAARLQPFRLDLGPRIWADLGQRPLALPAA